MNNSNGFPRPVLASLVFALPVLIVAFAVVAAGYLLTVGGADPGAARALKVAGVVLLMLTLVDVTLLVGVLGIVALLESPKGLDHAEPRATRDQSENP